MFRLIVNIIARLLRVKSPSLGMRYALDEQIKEWMGIPDLERWIGSVDRRLNDQVKMVGIDVHQKNRRGGVQTEIIFVSHLGRDGMGSVHIVDAEFGSYGELEEYVRWARNAFKVRPAIDGPVELGRMFRDL